MVIPELAYTEMDAGKLVLVLAKAGLTNSEIAVAIGMTPSKFSKMLQNYPDFWEMLNDAKEDPNGKVEQALFKRALGYQVKEIIQKAGKPVQVTIKEYAPDPVSCIFWLKNRSPKRWRDVIEMKHTLADRMSRAHEAVAERSRGMLSDGEGIGAEE